MAKIIYFPSATPKILGALRARKRHKFNPEDYGQLSLFEGGNVISIQPRFDYFAEALLLDEQGDERAELYYQKAIENNQQVADAHCNLAILLTIKSDWEKAIVHFSNCLACDSLHYEAHYNLANVFAEKQSFELAKTHYLICIKINPNFGSAYYNLALILLSQRNYREAMQYLETFINMPKDIDEPLINELLKTLKQIVS